MIFDIIDSMIEESIKQKHPDCNEVEKNELKEEYYDKLFNNTDNETVVKHHD